MALRGLDIAVIAICGVAWVMTAVFLILDLVGLLPFKHRRNTRAFRLQSSSGLALMTGVVLSQVAVLRDWPRSIQLTLHVLDMFLALAVIAIVIAVAATQGKSRRDDGSTRA